ncbi:MAG: peptidyl-prolyl cis-trans isomerase [Candidatus Omnitrophica bacterium]|nr:peptidyl-prolyl cis-trans isomerase [Candidatus Omnitrophota bacterium]
MKRSLSIVILLGSFVFLLCGCDSLNFLKSKKSVFSRGSTSIVARGTVIAKAGNIPITQEDLNQDILSYNEMIPADKPEKKITTREQRIEYVKNEMVRRALLYQEALNRGLDNDEEIAAVLDRTKMELCVVKLMKDETDKTDVSAKEVEDAYNTYKDQLKEPEQRNIREIVVGSEQDAKEVLVQLLQGADFATLAKERSRAPSSKDGGDLGFIDKNKSNKFVQFDAVAFSDTLEVGRTSNIFKGPDGYYILKLEAKKGGKQKSLSEMYDDIKRTLVFLKKQQEIDDLISKLSKTNKVDIKEGEIK